MNDHLGIAYVYPFSLDLTRRSFQVLFPFKDTMNTMQHETRAYNKKKKKRGRREVSFWAFIISCACSFREFIGIVFL